MNGSEILLKSLEKEKVKYIFGYPGAANIPVYSALAKSRIKHILTRGEQAAAHAAAAYGCAASVPGVCLATSGPGATNLITGIATAYMDSAPLIAITGQVTRAQIGTDSFQEADITGATEPFTKHNYLVSDVSDIPKIIKEAFTLANTGRKGPVLIDIPFDILLAESEFTYPDKFEIRGYKPKYKGNQMQIKRIVSAIKKAKHPLIVCGGGVLSSKGEEILFDFSKNLNIPYVTTLMAASCIRKDSPLSLGMIGYYGHPSANEALSKADFVIVCGSRLTNRATCKCDMNSKTIVHIDIDPAEIGKNVDVTFPVVGDVSIVLEQIKNLIPSDYTMNYAPADFSQEDAEISGDYINPQYVFRILSKLSKENTYITTDVGNHQIWAAKNFNFKNSDRFFTSGGLGTMGYGIPAAIGVKTANPSANVIAICGDGSFQMSMAELSTIKENLLPIKIILFDNSALGMIKTLNPDNSLSFATDLTSNPDFSKIAKAYSIEFNQICDNNGLENALKKLVESDKPYILSLKIDPFNKNI